MVEIEVANRSGTQLDVRAAADLIRQVLGAEGVADGREAVPEGPPRQLGDVVLCPQVVGDAWRAPLVHAVLHLVGYDHGPEMQARERDHR